MLITLAKRTEISLDWLLLGEGPEIRGLGQTEADLAKSLRTYLLASLLPTRKGKSRGFLKHAVPEGDDLLAYATQLVDSRVADAERASHESARLLWYQAVAARIGRATSAGERTRLRALLDPAMVELFQAARTENFAKPGDEPPVARAAEAPEAQPGPPTALFRDYPGEAPLKLGLLVTDPELYAANEEKARAAKEQAAQRPGSSAPPSIREGPSASSDAPATTETGRSE